MFNKLVTNLPFNPGLVGQVSFYAKRLHQDATLRRFGFILVVLSLIIQMFAALYPAQKSLAASPNHILNGISSKSDILKAWDANTGNIRAIYGKFGVTRANIADIPNQKPNSTVVSVPSNNYWSIGRLPLSNFGISGSQWGERTMNISGNIVYQRPLHAWDTGASSSYKAYMGKTQDGVTFWILEDCGNLTFKGAYLPAKETPNPKLVVHKTRLSEKTVKPGDIVKFRIEYQNTVVDSLATDFAVTDPLGANFEFVGSTPGLDSRDGQYLVVEKRGQFGYTPTPLAKEVNVRVKLGLADGTEICNKASVTSIESSDTSETPCVVVHNPSAPPVSTKCTVAGKESLDATDANCVVPPGGYCIASTEFAQGSNKNVIVRTASYPEGTSKVSSYSYDVDIDGKVEFTDKTAATNYDKAINNLNPGKHAIAVSVSFTDQSGKTTIVSTCKTEINVAEDARVNLSKTVRNVTQNITNANGTQVKNGDTLVFTITTKNVTSTDYKDFSGEDYFGAVLDYADIIDLNELSRQGMTLDVNKYLHWTSLVSANSSDNKTVTVKVKDVIPSTNRPSNASSDYNCTLSNKYGNEVTLSVGCPLVKNVEQVTGKLPNTGPGTSVAIGFSVATLAGYFFSRSRLLARELDIIRSDYAAAGSS